MPEIVARHFETGRPIRITTSAGRIESVEDLPAESDCDGLWVAPAFWDIQFNGRWGISFSDASLTVDQVIEIVHAQAPLGSARVCPTLITASREETAHGIRTITEAVDRDPLVASMFAGIHLEGPWISERDGYRGAHPLSAVRDPDLEEFAEWQRLAQGGIAIVTLAPERPGSIEAIRALKRAGVVVAVGHTAADGPTLGAAREAGATLSTHLGNGIVKTLDRHPNPIWHQAADDALSASFIADGHHVDPLTLSVLIRAKGIRRSILVSDASPLAGLPPGRYGEWEVHPSGKIVVAGTPYLAGSNQTLADGISLLLGLDPETLGLTDGQNPLPAVISTVVANPAQLLGRRWSRLESGERVELVIFRFDPDLDPKFQLLQTYLGTERYPHSSERPPTPPV